MMNDPRRAAQNPDFDTLCDLVRKELSPELFEHSLRVADCAVHLLEKHAPEHISRGRIAGLLHDIAKPLAFDELMKRAEEFGILINSVEQRSPWLLHAKVGALMAKFDFGITDEDVLHAIEWHTVGRKSMSDCGMAVYLADIIEPERSFPGVEVIRKAAEVSLGKGCIAGVRAAIKYVVDSGWPIDPSTLEFYNWLLEDDR
ncbi:bis(5'-nucleosyl)-tetraphosphatase (symmetrical) YqeK [bacterium]|nr:bis(5'-nucleosyl)-tetraphosphatase (symmetrical) YqeK [bacterium]